MGSSQSEEVQARGSEEVAAPVSNGPKTSRSNAAQDQERSINGVKRKRRKSSEDEQPRRKKKKHSEAHSEPTPTSETRDGAQASEHVEIPQDTPKQLNGKLTPIQRKRKKSRSQVVPPASDEEDEEVPAPDAEEDDDIYSLSRDTEASLESEEEKSLGRKAINSHFVCHVCGREFENKKHLARHKANPRIHAKRHKCRVCDTAFYQLADLREHQNDADHKSKNALRVGESRGAFTEKEKAKLNKFRERFCQDYSVSEFEFNNLMTLMGRRKSGSDWPNPDITASELRDLFYNVLPDRSRKSLSRYRERYFQNVEQDATWTDEQIDELRELVEEKGKKWVEIAELLGRTQDSVYQKWKNRIRQGDGQRFERWQEDEREALIAAVRETKEAAGFAQDFSSDDKINWTAVSDRLGRTRNAQQCAVYWKRVYRPRQEAIARGEEVRPFHHGRNKPESTKSRRASRRRATRDGESVEIITPRRKGKSAAYITESDEEEVSGQRDRSRFSKRRKSRRSDTVPMTSDEVEQVEEDKSSKRNGTPDQHQQSRGDLEELVDENAMSVSPSKKKPKKKRLIDVMTSSPPALRDTPNLQRASPRQPGSSSQAVNGQQQPSTVSPTFNRGKSTSTSHTSVVIPPPRVHETPRLPPPRPSRTPQRVTSLTQAFDNTQAPTSARTAGHTTPEMHMIEEERPSPDIEMRLQPVRKETAGHSPQFSENGDDDDEDEQQIEDSAIPLQPDFEVYDSGTDHSDDNDELPQIFSSGDLLERLTDTLGGEESPTRSDTEASNSDDEDPPQMFSSAAPDEDAEESARAESDAESDKENDEQEDAGDSETAYTDDEQPPQMFSSAAPAESVHSDMAESDAEDVDDDEEDEAPQMFSSTLPGADVDESPAVAHEPESESDTEEAAAAEAEDDDSEDNDATNENENEEENEQPQIFTSTIPDTLTTTTTTANHQTTNSATPIGQSSQPQPESTAPTPRPFFSLNHTTPAPPHHQPRPYSPTSSTSSSDAHTIPPNGSARDSESESANEATRDDFFAHLEAEATRVRSMQMQRAKRRGAQGQSGVRVVNGQGRRERGDVIAKKKRVKGKRKSKRKRKGVYEISSSSSEEEEDGEL